MQTKNSTLNLQVPDIEGIAQKCMKIIEILDDSNNSQRKELIEVKLKELYEELHSLYFIAIILERSLESFKQCFLAFLNLENIDIDANLLQQLLNSIDTICTYHLTYAMVNGELSRIDPQNPLQENTLLSIKLERQMIGQQKEALSAFELTEAQLDNDIATYSQDNFFSIFAQKFWQQTQAHVKDILQSNFTVTAASSNRHPLGNMFLHFQPDQDSKITQRHLLISADRYRAEICRLPELLKQCQWDKIAEIPNCETVTLLACTMGLISPWDRDLTLWFYNVFLSTFGAPLQLKTLDGLTIKVDTLSRPLSFVPIFNKELKLSPHGHRLKAWIMTWLNTLCNNNQYQPEKATKGDSLEEVRDIATPYKKAQWEPKVNKFLENLLNFSPHQRWIWISNEEMPQHIPSLFPQKGFSIYMPPFMYSCLYYLLFDSPINVTVTPGIVLDDQIFAKLFASQMTVPIYTVCPFSSRNETLVHDHDTQNFIIFQMDHDLYHVGEMASLLLRNTPIHIIRQLIVPLIYTQGTLFWEAQFKNLLSSEYQNKHNPKNTMTDYVFSALIPQIHQGNPDSKKIAPYLVAFLIEGIIPNCFNKFKLAQTLFNRKDSNQQESNSFSMVSLCKLIGDVDPQLLKAIIQAAQNQLKRLTPESSLHPLDKEWLADELLWDRLERLLQRQQSSSLILAFNHNIAPYYLSQLDSNRHIPLEKACHLICCLASDIQELCQTESSLILPTHQAQIVNMEAKMLDFLSLYLNCYNFEEWFSYHLLASLESLAQALSHKSLSSLDQGQGKPLQALIEQNVKILQRTHQRCYTAWKNLNEQQIMTDDIDQIIISLWLLDLKLQFCNSKFNLQTWDIWKVDFPLRSIREFLKRIPHNYGESTTLIETLTTLSSTLSEQQLLFHQGEHQAIQETCLTTIHQLQQYNHKVLTAS